MTIKNKIFMLTLKPLYKMNMIFKDKILTNKDYSENIINFIFLLMRYLIGYPHFIIIKKWCVKKYLILYKIKIQKSFVFET